MGFDQLVNAMDEAYGFSDKTLAAIIIATALSVKLPGEAVWTFLVGPPASGKTEAIRAILGGTDLITFVDTLTPAALISGNPKRDTSLYPKLINKCLVIKDFTAIMEMNSVQRNELLGMLRPIYDGFCTKAFSWGTRSYEGTFSLLSCVTNYIEAHKDTLGQVGERFLYVRWKPIGGILHKNIEEVRKHISALGKKVIADTIKKLDGLHIHNLDEFIVDDVKKSAMLLARLRTSVLRDGFTREVLIMPECEGMNRIMCQLAKVALICGVIESVSRTEVINRILLDGIPSVRKAVLECIALKKINGWSEIREYLGVSKTVTSRVLEDMCLLGILKSHQASKRKFYDIVDDKVVELLT